MAELIDAALDAAVAAARSSGMGGADWQVATASAVSGGTITASTATGSVPSVRVVCPTPVAAGDKVAISQNAAGSWICVGISQPAVTRADLSADFPAYSTPGWDVVHVRRVGGQVWLRGRSSQSIAAATNTWSGAVPAGYRPLVPEEGWAAISASGTTAHVVRVQINPSGEIQAYSHKTSAWIGFNMSWLIA